MIPVLPSRSFMGPPWGHDSTSGWSRASETSSGLRYTPSRVSKLGVVLPFHAFPGREIIELAQEAEERGYDTAWAAEASGADALTTLAVIASHTSRLRVATGVVPIQTRTPIVLAMAATTLGHLAPGRVALGIGVASPILVGPWHRRPFPQPLPPQ